MKSCIKSAVTDMFAVVYEEQHGLPRGTILEVIREGGADGSWSKLECGEYNLHQFGKKFSEECSNKVGANHSLLKLFLNAMLCIGIYMYLLFIQE